MTAAQYGHVAVKTRIWTALISMLLHYLQLSSGFGWRLANLVALLRIKLLPIAI